MNNQITLNPSQIISVHDNTLITTSVQVADVFNKRHRDIVRKIDKLEIPNEFRGRNFSLTDFIDKNGDTQKYYEMTKDGFVFLVMSFTGKLANQIKIAYIDAFNFMAEKLHSQQQAKLESPYIEGKQLQHIKAGVKRIVNKTGKSYQTVYGGLNHFFGAPNINEIEKGYYGRVCAYLDIPTEFKVPADTMSQQLLELKTESHIAGLAILKHGAKALAVQDDKLEKVGEHLRKAAIYFEEARQCRGAIYEGFHESIVRLNVTKEENQQSNKKAEDIFNHWRARKQM